MSKILVALVLSISLSASAIEKANSVFYCHGKTVIEYRLVNPEKDGAASDVDLTVNGKTNRHITAYS
jgi:uncharacterized membrane protein YccF (DUF307 family)